MKKTLDPLPIMLGRIALDENGCWQWTGWTDTGGYGAISIGGRGYRAHRVMFERLRGPIDAGLTIDHLCRVRKCVNPWHMEVVDKRTNLLRGIGACAMNARKTHCPKGHPLEGDNLYIPPRGGRECRLCKIDHSKAYTKRRRLHRSPKADDLSI